MALFRSRNIAPGPASAPSSDARSGRGEPQWFGLMAGVLALWLIVHGAYWGRLIYHDAWLYNFPKFFGIAKAMACSGMPDWLARMDSGTPVSAYTTSDSITNPLRLALLFVMSCLKPGVTGAVYFHKAHILILYLCLAAGMYAMGRVLYRRPLSAVYLFAATLFAGLCMEAMHSDQAIMILFWLPWIVISVVLFHRDPAGARAPLYLNATVLFTALQALDQTPHFTAFAAGLALVLYAALEPRALLAGVRLHWRRLWPAAIVALLTAADLYFLLGEITRQVPSLRATLSVDPGAIADSGFVQPTALIGAFLPLGFIVPFDQLEFGLRSWLQAAGVAGGSRFVFRADVAMFYAGIIPIVLTAVFLLRSASWRLRAGWGGFALLCLIAPMRDSGIYRLLFHIPFFDIFRSYLLLLLFGIFALLVMSGYGMDALLTAGAAERRRLAAYALLLTAAFAADAAAALAWLLALPDSYATLPHALALDALILTIGLSAVAWAVFRSADIERGMAIAVVALALSQAIYQAETYRVLGTPLAEVVASFGLDRADRAPLAAAEARDPNGLTRKLCTRFAECYLSTRDTASLSRDLEGTFLRSRDEAVFQPGLARPVVEALSAIGHPIFWTSRRAEPYADAAELTARLNANAARIGSYLGEVVNVRAGDLERLGRSPGEGEGAALSDLSRGLDRLRLSYTSAAPFYLDAAIAYDPHWRASLGGQPAALVRGNFGGLALAVPAGSGVIELSYVNRASELFFATRIAMGLAGLALVLWLAWDALLAPRRRPGGPSEAWLELPSPPRHEP
jgi:hypothetical protein